MEVCDPKKLSCVHYYSAVKAIIGNSIHCVMSRHSLCLKSFTLLIVNRFYYHCFMKTLSIETHFKQTYKQTWRRLMHTHDIVSGITLFIISSPWKHITSQCSIIYSVNVAVLRPRSLHTSAPNRNKRGSVNLCLYLMFLRRSDFHQVIQKRKKLYTKWSMWAVLKYKGLLMGKNI
jgi:hypothetical protein